MRRMLHLLISGFALLGVFVVLTPGRALVDRVLFPDEATLGEGLTATIAQVHETAGVVATASEAELVFAPAHRLDQVESADPEHAGELSNNYSLGDHSNKARFPGYNDCDTWHNAFDDGWSAYYGVTAGIANLSETERDQLLDIVWSHWESQGYAVQELTQSQGRAVYSRLWIETPYGSIQFNVDPRRGTASVRGTTICLPPG